MIVNMHYHTPRFGLQSIQAFVDSDRWLYLKSSLRDKSSPIMDCSGMTDVEVGDQVANVYNAELAHIIQFIRGGTTLGMLVALYRNKTEDPD